MRKMLILVVLVVGLQITGCGLLTKQEQEGLAESLFQARTLALAVQASTPDLVAAGDLSQKDADWLDDQIERVLPILDAAVQIAEGSLEGDPLAQLDLAIAALRVARGEASDPRVAEQIGRLTAGLSFYRQLVAAEQSRLE